MSKRKKINKPPKPIKAVVKGWIIRRKVIIFPSRRALATVIKIISDATPVQPAIIRKTFELLLRIQTKCCGVSKHQMSGGYYSEHQQMMIKQEEDEKKFFYDFSPFTSLTSCRQNWSTTRVAEALEHRITNQRYQHDFDFANSRTN